MICIRLRDESNGAGRPAFLGDGKAGSGEWKNPKATTTGSLGIGLGFPEKMAH